LLLHLHWRSTVLSKNTTTWLLYPDAGAPPFPTLYLLHGLTDDHTTWLRRTRLEVHAAGYPLILVMPDGDRGFYTNHHRGPRYADHIGLELPALIERTFPARSARDARAIGGQSMGGYGALRVGLAFADRFASVHSHSGGMLRPTRPMPEVDWDLIFGPNPAGTDHDLLALAQRAKSRQSLPALRLDCGLEDHLLDQNRSLHAELQRLGVAHQYHEFPGGHNWDYWEQQIPAALAWHAANLRISRAT